MPSVSVKDAAGSTQTIQTLPAVGAAATAASLPVTIASDQTVPVSLASVPSHNVTNAGTFAVQATITGANSNGQATMANSAPVVIASNQSSIPVAATLGTETTKVIGTVNITDISNAEYETVAASQTAQALGATGATGDYISGLLVIPATTSPGVVTLLDNATSIPVFVGGATSVSNLVPFFIPLGMKSVSGAWKVTTGANVSVIGIGNFT